MNGKDGDDYGKIEKDHFINIIHDGIYHYFQLSNNDKCLNNAIIYDQN